MLQIGEGSRRALGEVLGLTNKAISLYSLAGRAGLDTDTLLCPPFRAVSLWPSPTPSLYGTTAFLFGRCLEPSLKSMWLMNLVDLPEGAILHPRNCRKGVAADPRMGGALSVV